MRSSMSEASIAIRMACEEWLAPSLVSMLARRISTVRGLIASRSPISRFGRPGLAR